MLAKQRVHKGWRILASSVSNRMDSIVSKNRTWKIFPCREPGSLCQVSGVDGRRGHSADRSQNRIRRSKNPRKLNQVAVYEYVCIIQAPTWLREDEGHDVQVGPDGRLSRSYDCLYGYDAVARPPLLVAQYIGCRKLGTLDPLVARTTIIMLF